MADNVSRLLRSPKTIRARLTYNSPPPAQQPTSAEPTVTLHSQHAFLTDKYNPIPVSPSSYTRTILTEPTSLTSPKKLFAPETSIDEQRKNVSGSQKNPEPEKIHTETINLPDLNELKNTFVQRKEERDKCFNEFSNFLSKSFSATASQKISTLELLTATVGSINSVDDHPEMPEPSTTVNALSKPTGKVTSKTATLKLSPRTKPAKTIPISQRKSVRAAETKPPPTQARQKSTHDIPLLKIGSSRASSINQDTDRQSASGGHPPRNAYDSARARKFMAEQQKKRKLESKSVNVQEKCAIAERKRRLAELQRNTRKIVQRNLRQHPGKSMASAAPKSEQVMQNVGTTERDDQPEELSLATTARRVRPFIEEKAQNRRAPDRGAIHFSFPPPTPEAKVVEAPSTAATIQPIQETDTAAQTPPIPVANIDMPMSTVTISQSSPLAKNCSRRCGILRASPRNQQGRIPSPMNIHFDQLIAPKLGAEICTMADTLYESPQTPGNLLSNATNVAAADLQIPDVQLQTSAVVGATKVAETGQATGEGTTRKTSEKGASKNVPFWLRPSPMHTYPYNFIMAVRKKLDMIANPQLGAKKRAQQAKNEPASPRGRVSYFKRKNCSVTTSGRKSKGTDVQDISTEVNDAVAGAAKSNSDSEATLTNLSSVSLQLPPTDSQSGRGDQWPAPAPQAMQNLAAKPVLSDSDSQATLSISSTIFSQSSPEKKQTAAVKPIVQPKHVEPLCTEFIADMRLVSRRRPIPSFPFVSRRRGSEVRSAAASNSKTAHSTTSKSSSSQPNVTNTAPLNQTNIFDMLDSFNRSLSHAISINQRLQETLNKPGQVHRSVASGPDTSAPVSASVKSNANDEYSSNFESSSKSTKTSQSTSLLENESSIKSSSVPTTATSRSSATESVKTELSQPTTATDGQKTYDSTPKSSSSSKSTLIDTNQSLATTNSAQPEQSLSIHTQLDNSDRQTTNNSSIASGVARNLMHSFAATTSARSLDAPNSAGPSSSARIAAPSSVTSIRSSSSSTLTIKSARITAHLMPELPYVEDDDKENVSANSNVARAATETGKRMSLIVDQQQPPPSAADLNQSIGSDIFAVFNQTDIEYSVLADGNLGAHSATSTTTIVSETANVSYSTLGMYDQLLKTEDQKSLDLTALLKTREKALMDRTKGQIAWLELQKQKYRERGLTAQITAVKKKQRALLMQLERERAELAKSAKQSTAAAARPRHSAVLRISQMPTPRVRRASCPLVTAAASGQQITPKSAMRAINFAADNNLELMLQEREEALRQRRAHVESLVRWHQRLDEEESAVAAMESQLMARTNLMRIAPPQHPNQADTARSLPSTADAQRHSLSRQQQRQIMDIEQSLEVLQAMPSARHTTVSTASDRAISAAPAAVEHCDDSVSVRGAKLNRLWRRLTGDRSCKFIPERSYDLSKAEIAQVYEDAKRYVLAQFGEHQQRQGNDDQDGSNNQQRHRRHRLPVLDQTQLSAASATASSAQQSASAATLHSGAIEHNSTHNSTAPQAHHHHHIACDEFIVVPALNLNFTSTEEQSCSASDTEGGGGANTRTSGYYFTDSVQPMTVHREAPQEEAGQGEDEHNRKRNRLPSQDDGSVDEEMSSAKTFRLQLGRGSSLRDSAFSVDSLNSSRPELSEAASLPPPAAAKIGVSDEQPQSAIIVPITDRIIEDLAQERTELIADTTVPTLLETSIVEELSLSTGVDDADSASSLATAIGADKTSDAVSATDNDHLLLQQSYSDGFEATTSTSSSDKITEAIELPAATIASLSSSSLSSTVTPQVEEESLSEQLPTTVSTIANEAEEPLTTAGSSSMATNETPATEESGSDESNTISKEISEIAPVTFVVGAASSAAEAEAVSTSFEMPDIISEAEVLRRQQMRIEEEIKQLEENAAAPFYIREIPNKPPPPYVPPAHGSPMTAIFPSDARIRDLVFDRVSQLLDAPRQQPPTSTVADNITNIYERIALDICAECLDDIQLAQLPDASASLTSTATTHFKHPLAFYNPPDRLLCMQQHVLRQVKRLLRHPNAVHSSPPPSAQAAAAAAAAASLSTGGGQLTSETSAAAAQPLAKRLIVATTATMSAAANGGGFGGVGAKRRLWWNEIVLHEMMEDDSTWTNFDAERSEVLATVGNEIVGMLVQEAIGDCERAHQRKALATVAAGSNREARNGN